MTDLVALDTAGWYLLAMIKLLFLLTLASLVALVWVFGAIVVEFPEQRAERSGTL